LMSLMSSQLLGIVVNVNANVNVNGFPAHKASSKATGLFHIMMK